MTTSRLFTFFPSWFLPSPLIPDQRHTLRDRRPSTAACPACWAMGDKRIEILYDKKKIYCTVPSRAAKSEQESLMLARQAQQTHQERTPFICTLWVPIHLSFNKSAGATLPSLVSLFQTGRQPYPWTWWYGASTRLTMSRWSTAFKSLSGGLAYGDQTTFS